MIEKLNKYVELLEDPDILKKWIEYLNNVFIPATLESIKKITDKKVDNNPDKVDKLEHT